MSDRFANLPAKPPLLHSKRFTIFGNISRTIWHITPQSNNMKRLIAIAVLAIISLTAFAQTSPDEVITKFFDEYPRNAAKAIDDLYGTNPWTLRVKDAIDNLKKEVAGYTIDYVGKYYGYEPIVRKQFSESFILCSYMVKYDRQPMRFTFELYKPNDKWLLFSFKIDSELDDEIEQAAKLYYINLDTSK